LKGILLKPLALAGAAICTLALFASSNCQAEEIVRLKLVNSDFPIAAAVEVPAGKTTVYVSGAGAAVANPSAPANSIEAYGDTKTQTISALTSIAATLKRMNLEMKDVVKMDVFMVGDPAKGGNMDFAGFMEGYRMYFGTPEQPNLPARSAMRVAGLAAPGWLIEIEVTAVRP
jgi:enamine deaminase RidA (YjgF/YER057c/UK114 family)